MRFFGLGNLILWLARKFLFIWVKTQVFPEDLKDLKLDPNKPVCYVLQTRYFSNLLVIDRETKRLGLPRALRSMNNPLLKEKRSVFFLLRSDNAGAGPLRQNRFTSSPRLVRLLEAVSQHQELDVQLVPVTILWGRAPDKESSILKILFADSWATPGAFKQFIAIMLHGRNTMVRFSEPISLRDVVNENLGEERTLRKLSRVLRVHFRRQREIAIGPDLSHRRTQVQAVVSAASVQAAIDSEVNGKKKKPRQEVEAMARKYAHEIAADYSYPTIRVYDIFLTWLWTRLYDGVEVNHFDQVVDLAANHEIVYVPCHRSHIDYLLLSYVIYTRGLMTPHIAAGANLNMPVVGPILRRGGAFFLRRTFKGNNLYAAVFNEYLHMMITKGYAIEYFIEGGRSRTGRVLSPRTGMLSMTLKSYLRDHSRPIVFVPAYIGYEKLMEGATYVGELQGKPKKKESLWDLVDSIKKLKKTFGKVHLSFGEPIHLAKLLDEANPEWRDGNYEEEQKSPWMNQAIDRLANDIVTNINGAAAVNPMNLLSLALLATPKHAMDADMLARQLDLYRDLALKAPYTDRVTTTNLNGREMIAYGQQLKVIQRMKHPLGDILYLHEEDAVLQTYFRNNTLHLFSLPSLVACFFMHNPVLSIAEVTRLVKTIYPFVQSELFLRWQGEELDNAIMRYLDVLVEAGLLIPRNSEELAAPSQNSSEFAQLSVLAGAVIQTLQRYYMTVTLLAQQGSGSISQKRLEDLCALLAQRLSIIYEFNAPEFSDKAIFRNFIMTMKRLKIVENNTEGALAFDGRLEEVAREARLILNAEVRQTIMQLTRLDEEEISAALKPADKKGEKKEVA